MKTQTSVDWLAEQLHDNAIKALVKREITLQKFRQKRDEILKTARKMHREEVEGAYEAGFYDDMEDGKDFDTKYYTRTFETP